MYYATKRKNNSTRIVGLVSVVVINAAVFYIAASGLGAGIIREITETQVAIIDEPKTDEEPPPPPPPVDVDLPPPPPQVQLPDFVFERPPAPTAITAEMSPKPQPQPEARPAPPPPPTVAVKPQAGKNFGANMREAYPSASQRAEEEGVTKVQVCVDIAGKISNVQVIKSSGFDRLDQATLKELPRQRMTPAKGTDGKPMQVCGHIMDIEWKLER